MPQRYQRKIQFGCDSCMRLFIAYLDSSRFDTICGCFSLHFSLGISADAALIHRTTTNANWWYSTRRSWCVIHSTRDWMGIPAPRKIPKPATFSIWCHWASTTTKYHFKIMQSSWSTCASRRCTDSMKCVHRAAVFAWLMPTRRIWPKSA